MEAWSSMQAGLHLPQLDLTGEGLSFRRLSVSVDAARDCGFAAVSANDHFLFGAPWLDGPSVLAAAIERAGRMEVATTVSLPTLRGPVPLAKTLLTLDALSEGRLIAGVGPGSSRQDYEAVGVPLAERWQRFDEAVGLLRALLRGETPPPGGRYYPVPDTPIAPTATTAAPVPVWIGSWGSAAGLRRVARLGDGWLASAYNTNPAGFAAAMGALQEGLRARGRPVDGFAHALVTMWTWITEDRREAERIVEDRLAPLLGMDPVTLRGRVCVGPAQMCAELLSQYARAGCQRVHFWPIGSERQQIELLAADVLPDVAS
jgi:alkanesulfonate monooxygenase SsuD/methylene tetrahydromethanopterin reductase-like flavin-dependent oxidoreductase (luciferase family)